MKGIECNSDGRITSIDFDYATIDQPRLQGKLPEALTALTKLRTLKLTDQMLDGTLPSAYSSMTNLYTVDLGKNYLDGSVRAAASAGGSCTAQRMHAQVEPSRLAASVP